MRVISLNPAALALLAMAVVPLVVHLLVRRPARRLPFPTLRFVSRGSSRAARLRRLSDWPLLMLRTAILAAAAVALAQPLVITAPRIRHWEQRVMRLVLVDRSESAVPALAAARTQANREAESAWASRVIETDAISRTVRQAGETLAAFPPGMREIVIVSDFQEGTIDRTTFQHLPAGVGVRLVRVGASSQAPAPPTPGIPEVVAPVEAHPAVRRAIDAVASANGVSPSARDARAIVAFRSAPKTGELTSRARPLTAPWMADVIHQIVAADSVPAEARLFTAASLEDRLLIVTDVSPRSFAFPALLDAIHRGLSSEHAAREAWLPSEAAAKLAALERPAAGIPDDAFRNSAGSDARWFWAGVALLLGVETWLRSRRGGHQPARQSEAQAA